VKHPILIFGQTPAIIKVQRGDTNDLITEDPHEKPDRKTGFHHFFR
jgi:hypothetical protein